MLNQLIIRQESAADHAAIHNLITQAFKDSEYGLNGEALLVETLRKSGGLSLSIVAEVDSQIVGHIAFSPLTMQPEMKNWYCLAPLAVATAFRRQSIAKQLMKAGLAGLKKRGAQGCVVVGEPLYYQPLGFTHSPLITLADVPDEYLLQQSFEDPLHHSVQIFLHPAFAVVQPAEVSS